MAAFQPFLAVPHDHRGDHRWVCVRGTQVVLVDPDELGLPVAERLFLGVLDGSAWWAARMDDEQAPSPAVAAAGGRPGLGDDPFTSLMALHGRMSDGEWAMAGRGLQLVDWARCHRFCGRCATPTEASANERSRRCPACGLLAFPRLAPAVITLITRGDECLLGRNVNFPATMYSCLAGFVEPGETLEEAVRREVREEVGVELDELAYQSSQPWPFPHSLMLGFRATYGGGEVVCDPSEIADARWFRYDALPDIPSRVSIARALIDAWVAERVVSS